MFCLTCCPALRIPEEVVDGKGERYRRNDEELFFLTVAHCFAGTVGDDISCIAERR